MDLRNITSCHLRNAPSSVKALAAGFLFAISLAYLYAIGNIVMVVGWTPRAIAVHYYGAEEVLQSEKNTISPQRGEQGLDLDAMAAAPVEKAIGPRPSFKNLVQEGHFHLFGMTSFFFALTVLALFTDISERKKAFLVGAPYVAIVFDNLSFMATRFLGPQFAYLTAMSGALMGISFVSLWLLVVIEIFKKPEVLK